LLKYNIGIGINFVNYPVEYDIRILPNNVKSYILENNPNFKKHYGNYLLQDIQGSETYLEKFWQITTDLDQFRNQSFETAFPDYYKILKPHIK
jgi:hypothetical protein